MIKQAGFFRELEHGDPSGPSIHMSLGNLAGEVNEIVDYLSDAPILAATGTTVKDILGERGAIIGIINIQTDGEWAWPSDLAYYVEKYRVGIPDELGKRIAHLHSPPRLSVEELTALADTFFESMIEYNSQE
ncbi:hypothetical protein ETD86_48800 [Nonomuraea turkmeniaca]|uniref:Uncharacterized protein n=2 Tax=Nonomuraea turkmeniaca TaxID=103838 RepID=A0A5S4EX55_9ACTN|nr:hypothetical protein ETD86_48800 [Nonomuraea turkmeniaca]